MKKINVEVSQTIKNGVKENASYWIYSKWGDHYMSTLSLDNSEQVRDLIEKLKAALEIQT